LVEGIGQVVRGIGADEQDGAADLGQLDGQGARGGRLADAALAADEDPAEGALVEERLEGRLEGVGVEDGGHLCCCCVVGEVAGVMSKGLGLEERSEKEEASEYQSTGR
jgi:hypothetical protein